MDFVLREIWFVTVTANCSWMVYMVRESVQRCPKKLNPSSQLRYQRNSGSPSVNVKYNRVQVFPLFRHWFALFAFSNHLSLKSSRIIELIIKWANSTPYSFLRTNEFSIV